MFYAEEDVVGDHIVYTAQPIGTVSVNHGNSCRLSSVDQKM